MSKRIPVSGNGSGAVDLAIRNQVPYLGMEEFIRKMKLALPPLIKFLLSENLRENPIWGQLFPFGAELFGSEASRGYCIRPDIVWTKNGPMICELDFVPSGRGYLVNGLPLPWQQKLVCSAFKKWYGGCRAKNIAYAAATIDSCLPEMLIFSDYLRRFYPEVDISAVNADEVDLRRYDLVDRLLYRAELQLPKEFNARSVMTAEPWLDSKMVFALIHDLNMEMALTEALGLENLVFLRSVMPLTYSLTRLRERQPALLETIANNYREWIIKSADVETLTSWGSRSITPGPNFRREQFRTALFEGEGPQHKELGDQQVVQALTPSMNFVNWWDNALVDNIPYTPGDKDTPLDFATNHVFARLGVYFLVNTRPADNWQVTTPSYGVVTLRQDLVAHGAKDSMFTVFQASPVQAPKN